jgi:hypothetical protein
LRSQNLSLRSLKPFLRSQNPFLCPQNLSLLMFNNLKIKNYVNKWK